MLRHHKFAYEVPNRTTPN